MGAGASVPTTLEEASAQGCTSDQIAAYQTISSDLGSMDSGSEHAVSQNLSGFCAFAEVISDNSAEKMFDGWPAMDYHSSLRLERRMLPLKSVRVEADASDQGAGGTGSSKLVLIHYGLDGNVKHYAQVAIVGPCMERKDLLLTRASCDWLGDAEPNDRLSLLLVSPPWPGWRCCVQKCSISVNEEKEKAPVVEEVAEAQPPGGSIIDLVPPTSQELDKVLKEHPVSALAFFTKNAMIQKFRESAVITPGVAHILVDPEKDETGQYLGLYGRWLDDAEDTVLWFSSLLGTSEPHFIEAEDARCGDYLQKRLANIWEDLAD